MPAAPAASDYRALLEDLMADAMAVSRLARIRASSEADAPTPEARADAAISARIVLDLATAQERAARSVRRAILLVRRLDDPAAAKSPEARAAARKRIIREVEDAIERHTLRPTDAECLHAELQDRLDSPDLDDDIANLSTPEIIADICRDLGLASAALPGPRPWKRRTPDDVAQLCARAANSPAPHSQPAQDLERVFRLSAIPNGA